ncbi:hypothetical protein COB21_06170 [Candidatus Aerophobetes bacterium]|uniref:4-hydroxy-tetrahydrodipicolinate reductase n=1 Tax=Aerophobetes bacterium TaxID=2030807 RepID=A0A2A4WX27_UNCAE|nr:MAG: hypothetical protein COB21_06170 [Candidatus Aerophobetes bacterium]
MNIAIIGFGRLGASLERQIVKEGHSVTLKVSKPLKEEDVAALEKTDLIYVLVPPTALLTTALFLAKIKKPVVIGTTQWPLDQKASIFKAFKDGGSPMLYGANFSLSVILLKKSMELFLQAAEKVGEEFSIRGLERHHEGKVDAPSGTANAWHQDLKAYSQDPMPAFSYQREGDEKGFHQIYMENEGNVLAWSHRAKERSIFAQGALLAGLWLIDKQGVFTFEHYVETLL